MPSAIADAHQASTLANKTHPQLCESLSLGNHGFGHFGWAVASAVIFKLTEQV